MIVRIEGGEGQYEVPDSDMVELNKFDDALEAAVKEGNQATISATLNAMAAQVRRLGTLLDYDHEPEESDLIVPHPDSTLEELREALGEDGLLPG